MSEGLVLTAMRLAWTAVGKVVASVSKPLQRRLFPFRADDVKIWLEDSPRLELNYQIPAFSVTIKIANYSHYSIEASAVKCAVRIFQHEVLKFAEPVLLKVDRGAEFRHTIEHRLGNHELDFIRDLVAEQYYLPMAVECRIIASTDLGGVELIATLKAQPSVFMERNGSHSSSPKKKASKRK